MKYSKCMGSHVARDMTVLRTIRIGSACVRSIEFPVLLKLVWQDFLVLSCKLCLQQFAAEFVSIRRCVSC